MKKILSVLLVLGLLLCVGFASDSATKVILKKADVDLLTRLKVPVNSDEGNRIIQLVNLKLSLLKAYVEYGKNPTKKVELKIIKIMDNIDFLNADNTDKKIRTDDYTQSYLNGVTAGEKQARTDAMGEAFAIIKQQGYSAGVEHGRGIGYQKGYTDGSSGRSTKKLTKNINFVPNLFMSSNRTFVESAYNEGFRNGYAKKEAYRKAYLKDPNIKQNAYNVGYKEGTNAGYNLGYQQGYKAGVAFYNSHH